MTKKSDRQALNFFKGIGNTIQKPVDTISNKLLQTITMPLSLANNLGNLANNAITTLDSPLGGITMIIIIIGGFVVASTVLPALVGGKNPINMIR